MTRFTALRPARPVGALPSRTAYDRVVERIVGREPMTAATDLLDKGKPEEREIDLAAAREADIAGADAPARAPVTAVPTAMAERTVADRGPEAAA